MFALALAAAVAAQVCVAPPAPPKNAAAGATYVDDGPPPRRFQGQTKGVRIETLTSAQIQKTCSDGPPICGTTIEACSDSAGLHLPNPCAWADKEEFARLLCHELGHVNGWPASHGQ